MLVASGRHCRLLFLHALVLVESARKTDVSEIERERHQHKKEGKTTQKDRRISAMSEKIKSKPAFVAAYGMNQPPKVNL
jgi:hypothetical protein